MDAALTFELPTLSSFVRPTSFGVPFAPLRRSVAPFGHAHRRHVAPQLTTVGTEHDDGAEGSPRNARGKEASEQRRDMGDRKKFVKLEEDDLAEDWYGMLNLTNGDAATEDQIRSAYRKRCLETHPDKQPDKSDVLFKRVQRAFEILGNAEARRSYDSSRPFDDSIPTADVPEEKFYDVFGGAFDRNKKWSAVPNAPSIGDDSTPLPAVRKFYDFWLAFRTWRDFSNEVELQEIDDSMCREEKRYYQRENQRMLDKLLHEEMKRVRTMVDRAMKLDPRLRRQREKEAAERQKIVDARAAAKAAAEEAERTAKRKAEEAAKNAEQAQKQAAADAKNRLRNAVKEIADFFKANDLVDTLQTNTLLADAVRKPNMQWITQHATSDEAEATRDAVLGASPDVVDTPPPAEAVEDTDRSTSHVPAVVAFNLAILQIEGRFGRTRYGEAIKKRGAAVINTTNKAKEEKRATTATWTEEDLQLLQKATTKYPGGAVDRWELIGRFLHDKFTQEQIIERVKVLETSYRGKTGGQAAGASGGGIPDAPTAAAPTVADDWAPAQQRQLEQGLRELKDYKEKDKYTKVAAYVEGKNARQCFDRFKFLCAMRKK